MKYGKCYIDCKMTSGTELTRVSNPVTSMVYRMMHQALDDNDQTRKYGIAESIIQALIMIFLKTMS